MHAIAGADRRRTLPQADRDGLPIPGGNVVMVLVHKLPGIARRQQEQANKQAHEPSIPQRLPVIRFRRIGIGEAMKLHLSFLIFALVLPLAGQRHKIEEVNSEKPDGKLLQQIMQENDAAKRTALLEQFSTEFAQSKDVAWVLEQLQAAYVKTNDAGKILAAGDKLLAIDPDDPEAALQNLKAAEAQKDPALIRKYSAVTAKAARKMAGAPQPKEADEVAAWKSSVEYAKQVASYADYALYRAAVESRDQMA